MFEGRRKKKKSSNPKQATSTIDTLFAVLLFAGVKHSAPMFVWLGFLHRKAR